jgi:hemin uptake protein HemP
MATSVITPPAGSVPRLPSHTIFAGAQEVEIEHNGAVYRLRQTSLGKLILTK